MTTADARQHFSAHGPPGTLLGAEPMRAYLVPGVRLPAHAWRIRYATTTATGEPTVVGGIVLVPPEPDANGPRPLIGYAIGTQGLADRAAPSWQLARGIEYEASVIAAALRRGWAVTLTDYPGLGTPGNHPYVIGRALGPAVLDSIRAARQLDPARLDPAGPLAIFGYSEGGCAAGWALQLQPTYAPELVLAAGAVGAAPVDLETMVPAIDGGLFAFLLFYGLIGLDSAYPELDILADLNPRGRRAVALFNRTHIIQAIALGAAMPRKRASAYTIRSPHARPDVIARMRENRLGQLRPSVPVLIGAGTRDQVIPYAQAVQLHRDWQHLGADVRLRRMPIREHITGGISFAPYAFRFLAGHLAGAV